MTTQNGQTGGLDAQGQDALATTLHSVARFLRTVRMRSGIMLACLVVSGVLGTLYYVTAPRIFKSSASLFIVQIGSGVTQDASRSTSDPSRSMPTFRRLMKSEEVVWRTVQRLPERFRTQGFPEMTDAEAAMAIQDSLSVASEFNTNVMDVSFRSRHPKVACAVVASLLVAYESFMNDVNTGSSDKNLKRLEEQFVKLTEELKLKKTDRAALKATAPDFVGVGDGEEVVNIFVQNVKHLTEQHGHARRESARAAAVFSKLTEAVQRGDDVLHYADQLGMDMLAESMGLTGANAMLNSHTNQELLELQSKLQNALAVYGENNRTVTDLRAQIQTRQQFQQQNPAVRRQANQDTSRGYLGPQLLKMAEQKLFTTRQEEQALLGELQVEKNKAAGLNLTLLEIYDLDREIERLNGLRDSMTERMSQIDLNKDTFIRTEVSSQPRVPKTPVSPRLVVVGFLSLFMGSVAGLGIIWVLDIMDDKFRSPEELKLQLNTQILTMVPAMEQLSGDGIDAVMCHTRPNSTEAESFRSLRTNLEFASGETSRIVCTSTEPGDGKTTVSSNMAVAFAQSGRKTLVIDADMRRPGLSNLLELRDDKGLSVILRSTDDLEPAVLDNLRSTDVDGLDVISCGPRPVNPAELLSGERFANLLAWAETRYEQIIVDAPPVLAVTDPLIIGRLVDGVVLVVRPDKDRRRMVIRATESLQNVSSNLLGIVVNHLSGSDAGGYGYGYGYGYEYSNNDDHADESMAAKTTADDVAVSLSMIGAAQSPSGREDTEEKAA